MKKLEKQPYKIVQYKDGFSEDWGLGFSLMNVEETKGWEYNPVGKRSVRRDVYYRLTRNIESGDTIFSYGFKNED